MAYSAAQGVTGWTAISLVIGTVRRFAPMKRRPAAETDEIARPTLGDEQPPSDSVARTETPGDARV